MDFFNLLLEKPLAFIITISGIILLCFSGLNKFFKIEINELKSKRLLISGFILFIIGIPLYYITEKGEQENITVKLIKIDFFKNDAGHTCDSRFLHIRETFKIENVKGEKIAKIILNGDTIKTQSVLYQDIDKNFAINYCYLPKTQRNMKVMFITSSGKKSNLIEYTINSSTNIKEKAPQLSKY